MRKNMGMTATETITSNARVLGADPLVKYQPAEDGKERAAGRIGEEDLCKHHTSVHQQCERGRDPP